MSTCHRQTKPASRPGSWLGRILLIAGLALSGTAAQGQTPPAAAKAFLMAADAEPGTYAHRWATLIYTEAFKRLGMPVQIGNYSLARRSALANEGAIDGEVSRIYSYADTNPDLVRVDEPVMDFSFALFAANPSVQIARLEDLPATTLIVEHRRGILACENALKKFVPAERLSNVTSTDQGVKKLASGRTDLYCDIELYVREALHSAELKSAANVRKVIRIASVPTYPYLHRKHAALAPRLAAVLKQMKTEGLLDSYAPQVERELGWSK